MTPEQFLDRVCKKGAGSVYLFLGPEAYNRERCRRALIDAVLVRRSARGSRSAASPATIWIR